MLEGKYICIKEHDGDRYMIKGKVYNFVDGGTTFETGKPSNKFENIEQFNASYITQIALYRELLNGKYICIKGYSDHEGSVMTKDKVYSFENGRFVDDVGCIKGEFETVERFNDFYQMQIAPYQEEKPVLMICMNNNGRAKKGRLYEFCDGRVDYRDGKTSNYYKTIKEYLYGNMQCKMTRCSKPMNLLQLETDKIYADTKGNGYYKVDPLGKMWFSEESADNYYMIRVNLIEHTGDIFVEILKDEERISKLKELIAEREVSVVKIDAIRAEQIALIEEYKKELKDLEV